MPHRAERLSEALREELAELISYELSDPRVASATVTSLDVSPDKRHALVRIRVEEDADTKQTIAALEHAAPFLRHEVARRLELFRIPELHFEPDIASELGPRVDQLLKRIKKGRPRE
ncbi:MAG TPA: 30S ribosome-binding factor RbfA [Bryobacteraceae bacterium]|nr:30S ribosome-binding factor RbfA [Bryobacteraceae bacterium]